MSPEDQIRMLRMLPSSHVRGRNLPIPPMPSQEGGPFGNDPSSPFYRDGPDPFPADEKPAQSPRKEYRAAPSWKPKMIIGVDGTPVPSWESRPHTMGKS